MDELAVLGYFYPFQIRNEKKEKSCMLCLAVCAPSQEQVSVGFEAAVRSVPNVPTAPVLPVSPF